MPLRYLHTLFLVVDIEGWTSSTLKFIFTDSRRLWVPEMYVIEEASAVGFGGE